MLTPAHLQPVQRVALRAALSTPTHSLVRTRGGYIAPGNVRTSGAHRAQVVTTRCANWLHRDGLVAFEPSTCPDRITLTTEGLRLARELVQQHGQVGSA